MTEPNSNLVDSRLFLRMGVAGAATSPGLTAGTASAQVSRSGDRARDRWIGGKPSVLIFDVNETLIDFESMHPLFERVFGDKHALREWLGHLIMYSMTIALSGLYKDYFSLGQ